MKLNESFLVELAKCCTVSKDFIATIKPHIKYSYLPDEAYKSVFRSIFEYFDAKQKAPTVGILSQELAERDSLSIVAKMREVNVTDRKKEILEVFETFIKRARFVSLHKKVEDLYNGGEHDKAIETLAVESEAISEFQLTQGLYSRIYAGFEARQRERQSRDLSSVKIPTGIPQFDYHTRGGIDKGTGLLFLGRSGSGKSTALRWLGLQASIRGFNVLHFQAEGKKDEVEDAYDAMWTAVDTVKIREGIIPGATRKRINKALQQNLTMSGEIYVHAFEQFETASIADCRNELIELLKVTDIHLVLFDYLELFDPGDGKLYHTNAEGKRANKEATGRKIINIAIEFNTAVAAATQASNIKKEDWNNPDYVLTREDIANLKATIDPFAYCLTMNQTEDEDDNDVLRLSEEKLRHYKTASFNRVYKVAQSRRNSRLIDVVKTNHLFWDKDKKRKR